MPIEQPKMMSLRDLYQQVRYDSLENDVLKKATAVVAELYNWFSQYDKEGPVHPNLRFNAAIISVNIGDETLWNTEEHSLEQLSLRWVLGEYERTLRERLDKLSDWRNDLASASITQ